MSEKNVLDFTNGKTLYINRADLAAAIEHKVRNSMLPELSELKEKLTKLVKSRDNAVNLLIALRRDKTEYSEKALYVDACLERIHMLEVEVEDLNRTMNTLPRGDVIVKLTDEQARYYGL